MKKTILTVIAVLAVTLSSSCGLLELPDLGELIPKDQTENATENEIIPETEKQENAPSKEGSSVIISTESTEMVTATVIPPDDEVIAEFETAYKIYGSFHGTASDVEIDFDDSIELNGMNYSRTKILWTYGITDKESLIAYLNTVFSEDIVEELLYAEGYNDYEKIPFIADTDSGLYTLFGEFAMGSDMEYAGTEKKEAIKEADTKLTVRITAKYYPENWLFDDSVPEEEIQYRYSTIDYPYEYSDNEWKFTSFRKYY